MERPVAGALRAGRAYGYHIIISSASAVPLALDVLAQVPQVCTLVTERHQDT